MVKIWLLCPLRNLTTYCIYIYIHILKSSSQMLTPLPGQERALSKIQPRLSLYPQDAWLSAPSYDFFYHLRLGLVVYSWNNIIWTCPVFPSWFHQFLVVKPPFVLANPSLSSSHRVAFFCFCSLHDHSWCQSPISIRKFFPSIHIPTSWLVLIWRQVPTICWYSIHLIPHLLRS